MCTRSVGIYFTLGSTNRTIRVNQNKQINIIKFRIKNKKNKQKNIVHSTLVPSKMINIIVVKCYLDNTLLSID